LEKELIIAQTIRSEVWLSGTVTNEPSRELAEWNAAHVQGVTAVHNNLNVQLQRLDRNVPKTQAPTPKQTDQPAQARSGVLHYQGPTVPYGGKVVFDNLPKEPLRFTFDRSAWQLSINVNQDGTKRATLVSVKYAYQTKCDLGWAIVE
jgi:hypothetical protein